MTAPSRHVLTGLDEVRFGRGPARIQRDPATRRLTINIPDPRMSADHGRLVRHGVTWVLDDATSKNGCMLNGALVRQGVLANGDLLELGHTIFVFRVAPLPPGPPDVTADELARAAADLTTFSPELAASFARLVQIAASDVPVLILGESGTGKELAAHALHTHSGRAGPFVTVSLGALPEPFVEAAPVSHRGSNPGGVIDRLGLIRSADRGTMFLDEIAELRASSRAGFLRVLGDRKVTPPGDTRAVCVDVRFCAATHHAVDDLAESGEFRRERYTHLFGFTIELPPLRRRREDLGLFVRTLLARWPGSDRVRFTPAAARLLHRHDWPYNVRQLERALAQATALTQERAIDVADLSLGRVQSPTRPEIEHDDALRAKLIGLLELHRGNIAVVARALDQDRMQIHRWMRRFALDLETFRR
ncbi:MAG TPA: sigma 54-interacting transcriptional regulator [Kofleriaceae bacterium]|nr:sigma 54-interacting transcriptional regulator [Kofleriaceae bacterium]